MIDLYFHTVIIEFCACASLYIIETLKVWHEQEYVPEFPEDFLSEVVILILMFLLSFFIFPLPILMIYYFAEGLFEE